jgi:hypothetical protein
MNYQKKITEIENAQKSLILLKKEVLIAERKSKKLASIDASLSQTEKNAAEFYRQIYKLNKQFFETWRIVLKLKL